MAEHHILDTESNPDGLQITPEAQESLRTAATWSTFLAILGFIAVGFMGLAGMMAFVFTGFIGSAFAESGVNFPIWIVPLFYLGLAAAYFFPILFLYRFASRTKTALQAQSTFELTDALNNLGKHYKWIGVMVLVLIGVYILFIAAFSSMIGSMTNGF